MVFDWLEYLKLARDLAGQSAGIACEEARIRTSVSRCYYAAYHKALNYLTDVEKYSIPSRPESHREVRELYHKLYEKHSDSSYRKIENNLDRLGIDRVRADYHCRPCMMSGKASQAVLLAEKVVNEVATLMTKRGST